MSEIHGRLSLNAHPHIVEGHAHLLEPVECAVCMVLCTLDRPLFLIAVVVAWVEALVGVCGSHIKERVSAGVPPSIANVETANKEDPLIYKH